MSPGQPAPAPPPRGRPARVPPPLGRDLPEVSPELLARPSQPAAEGRDERTAREKRAL